MCERGERKGKGDPPKYGLSKTFIEQRLMIKRMHKKKGYMSFLD